MHYTKALFVAVALLGIGAAHANDRVRVGKAQGSAWTFLPLDVGIEQGFFAKQNLEIENSDLGGDAKVQQALAASGIDLGLGSGPGMAFAAKGSPAIAVARSPARRGTYPPLPCTIRPSRQSPISKAR
jgi:NitT/TauT family transport system substrate-binding protein